MKNIKSYIPGKYSNSEYEKVEDGIYKTYKKEKYAIYETKGKPIYVTSLSFEQEPELGEGDSPSYISQYPLEYLLGDFNAYISDFYDELNNKSTCTCYQEFASYDLEDIKKLRGIIGKHVYEEEDEEEDEDGELYSHLVIE